MRGILIGLGVSATIWAGLASAVIAVVPERDAGQARVALADPPAPAKSAL